MFTTYVNKYYAQLCCGGPGTPGLPPVTGLVLAGVCLTVTILRHQRPWRRYTLYWVPFFRGPEPQEPRRNAPPAPCWVIWHREHRHTVWGSRVGADNVELLALVCGSVGDRERFHSRSTHTQCSVLFARCSRAIHTRDGKEPEPNEPNPNPNIMVLPRFLHRMKL